MSPDRPEKKKTYNERFTRRDGGFRKKGKGKYKEKRNLGPEGARVNGRKNPKKTEKGSGSRLRGTKERGGPEKTRGGRGTGVVHQTTLRGKSGEEGKKKKKINRRPGCWPKSLRHR